MKKILVIGQTPPPFHGQAMMISRFVNADFHNIQIFHIRSSFSTSVDEIGKASFKKIFHLFQIVFQSYSIYFRYKPEVLVIYPITNSISGIIKDNLLLFFIRWMFKKTVFYFRSAGLIDFLNSKSKGTIFFLTFFTKCPDLCILLNKDNPKDNEIVLSKNVVIIPNGIEDSSEIYPSLKSTRDRQSVFNCLYIGLLTEDKGVLDLIEAFRILVYEFEITRISLSLVGKALDSNFEDKLILMIQTYNLSDVIFVKGQMVGDDKWNEFINSDVLCFPTYYENESFGNVILEGFLSSLPVIATDWRGVKNVVDDGINGIIVPIKSPNSLANAILMLYSDEDARINMAKNARIKFENNYQLRTHLDNLEKTFLEL